VFGGVKGSECHAVWTCVLLGVYWGLGEGEAGVSALSEGSDGAAYFAFAGLDGRGI
jgi:hypothetical protein